MHRAFSRAAALAVLSVAVSAHAATSDVLQPIQLGNEFVRFDRGDYVIDLPGQRAAVRIRSMPDDHDYMSFVVAVLNTGSQPINVDVGNIRIEGTKEAVRVLTRAEMQQKAERRAGWAKFFTNFGSVLVASSQASQRNYYSATTVTRYGIINTQLSAPCYGCQAAANETIARAQDRIAQIQGTLDSQRDRLSQQMLQLTTVDPGQYYGGRIFLTRFKHEANGQMRLIVTIDGEAFQFGFRFAPSGAATPTYRMTVATRYPAAPAPAPTPAYENAPAATPSSAAPLPQFAASAPPPANLRVNQSPLSQPTIDAATTRVVYNANSNKWHRYYTTLLESGVSKNDAKKMADEEFGSIS